MTGEFKLRQDAFRKDEIERAAGDEIVERGCASFTMEGVARRLGMSKATLYKHFSTREELARAAISRRCSAAFTEALGAIGSHPSDAAGPDEAIGLAASLVRRCLGITAGIDGSGPPCCLSEVVCPFADLEHVERAFAELGFPSRDGISFTHVLMAATASTMQMRRAEHRLPTEGDVSALLEVLFPQPTRA